MHCCITVYSEVCACRPSPPPLLSSRVAFQVSCETAADKGLVEFHPLGSLLLYGGLFKSLRGHTTNVFPANNIRVSNIEENIVSDITMRLPEKIIFFTCPSGYYTL